ncbi:hypothetical protein M406DRAFT_295252 [Cryphonectria parasitica EP155]|uniref:polynucleotide adenylyltransferase n=1 Tax=Cryphonectria parasitica (strain ATCC 38755 / EP155) TaxID=660469 RepID=A0A9P4XVZ7_CRYP1|nr:uncharacterized protein M406DRAFT_295252 [Cryphonectria parasitica EP155]KAF3761580.1 hypothetical protein M406DRAFT_295252 [Cryphonectria parasitica EP155]
MSHYPPPPGTRPGGAHYGLPPPPPPPAQAFQGSNGDRDSRGGDAFRPPQSDFTFRSDKPSGVGDSYRPAGPDGPRGAPRGPARGPYNNDRRPGARSFRGRGGGYQEPRRPWKPFRPAERAILQDNNNAQPAEDFADAENGVQYRSIDQLSDSDETDMDISDSDNETGGPSAKRTRTTIGRSGDGDDVPKWSNPDPYTALPPVDESEKKRKDMVQLIRKARVDATANARTSLPAPADDEDFIRCESDSGDEDKNEADDVSKSSLPPRPEFAAASHASQVAPQATQPPLNANGRQRAVNAGDLQSSSGLASRKRFHDDVLKLPDHARLKPAPRQPSGGTMVKEWRPKSGEHSCPWVQPPSSKVPVNVRFHMEVRDFYEHVKPCSFEERLRSRLVDDLNRYLSAFNEWKGWQMYPFGSFMSGLYLPTGDMDLAFCSRVFVNGGPPRVPTETQLRALTRVFRKSPLAVNKHIEPVLKARVPLIKYVDNTTGLKIDISFENNSGLIAIDTFKAWREQWPAMPILVTVIKQYLLMRGLNEPVNGGVGGFSVICMVVSMLQMMPVVQSGDMIPQHDLGALLMHFFDLYGHRFNYETTALRLNPPGYVNKNRVQELTYRNPKRLSIIDPNNPANDIAGGSANYAQIVQCFREAHRLLQERMVRVAAGEHHDSILSVILGGNYSTFREQRQHLRKLHMKVFGFADE